MIIGSENYRIPQDNEEDYSVVAIENLHQKDQIDLII